MLYPVKTSKLIGTFEHNHVSFCHHVCVYRKRFNDLASGKVSPEPGLILQKELASAKKGGTISENTLYKVQELYADPVLFEYCRHPKILDYVECFTGPNIVAIHTMLINKPPDTGTKSSRHPLHQDLHYFPIRPADKIICAWSAMERVHKDNGCLVAVPGSHRGDHLEHDYPKWEVSELAVFNQILTCLNREASISFTMASLIYRCTTSEFIWKWTLVTVFCSIPYLFMDQASIGPKVSGKQYRAIMQRQNVSTSMFAALSKKNWPTKSLTLI